MTHAISGSLMTLSFLLGALATAEEKRDPHPLLGKGDNVKISPDSAWRESEASFEITITVGEGGLPPEDSFGIVNGSYIDRWNFSFPNQWWGQEVPWQATNPDGANHLAATCSRKGVNIRIAVGTYGGRNPFINQPSHFVRSLRERMRYAMEVSSDADLQEGDIISIRWSNVKTPTYSMQYFFLPFRFSLLPEKDRDLPIRRGGFSQLPSIRICGRSAVSLHLACRPLHGKGESFALNIAAIDEYGNPAEDFSGEVALSGDPSLELPKSVHFAAEDRGCMRVKGIRAGKPGWFRITASGRHISGHSNYVAVSSEKPPSRLFFGDIHTHTLDCDGTNDILEHFQYGPRVAGLDFGAVSPHAEYFGHKDAWQRCINETTRANIPGEFVTFYGYEWAGQGHVNAYFLKPDEVELVYSSKRLGARSPDTPAFRKASNTEPDFLQTLGSLSQPVFAVAHCHTVYAKDTDVSIIWLDEIYSCHKMDRGKREKRLRDNLEKGLRLGVVAGSDMHRLSMGHLCKEPGKIWPQGGAENVQFQTAGLQATFSPELTREGLYQGMKARHTYGTSGARIVLLFRCGKNLMGSEIVLEANTNPVFEAEVGGTAPISELALCRFDGKSWTELLKEAQGRTDLCQASWKDEDFGRKGIYYVRVTQNDGEQAWSSPIWLSRKNMSPETP